MKKFFGRKVLIGILISIVVAILIAAGAITGHLRREDERGKALTSEGYAALERRDYSARWESTMPLSAAA